MYKQIGWCGQANEALQHILDVNSGFTLGCPMPNCYICGSQIQTGNGVRKSVHTNASVSGFNFSSNVPLNWFVNSVIRKRPVGIRNSYSLRTLCPSCATTLDAKEAYKRRIMMIAGGLAVAILGSFFLGAFFR